MKRRLSEPMPVEELRSILGYNPDTGKFWWKVRRCNNGAAAGDAAGHYHRSGYVRIRINKKRYSAHQLAWFLFYGEWPNKDIDHKNLIASDNRIENLRLATESQNLFNRRTTGLSGFRGVTRHKSGGWVGRISIDGRTKYLGYFATPEEAYNVVCHEIKTHRGEFGRTD